MNRLQKITFFILTLTLVGAITLPAFAQVRPLVGIQNCGPGNPCSGSETFDTEVRGYMFIIINTIAGFIGVVSTAFLLYAAFKYITSQGDTESASTAKKQIVYAMLGILVWGVSSLLIRLATPGVDSIIAAAELSNVIYIYTQLALEFVAVIAGAFLVYAGFKYITSQGDTEAANTAKKQIVYAIIGIIVAGLARIIVVVVAAAADSGADLTVQLEDKITDIVNAFLSLGAVITAVYIVVAGFTYITASGDEERAGRAKMQILYAVIGLVVIIISGVLVNFVIRSVT